MKVGLIASEARGSIRYEGPVALGNVGQVDVVVPHAPQTGQDLSEGGHDQVFAVPETKIRFRLTDIEITYLPRVSET